MRRKQGALLPLEERILHLGAHLDGEVDSEFYAFSLAKHFQDLDNARRLIAYGTLYKALRRMESAGLLSSRWEEPGLAEDAGRPRRRLYRLTDVGRTRSAALGSERAAALKQARRAQPGLARG